MNDIAANNSPKKPAAAGQAASAQSQASSNQIAARAAAASTPGSKAGAVNVASASLRGSALYVDPALAATGRPSQIASQPVAKWFGDWSPNVQAEVNASVSAATVQNALAILVAYNIPQRDCGSYSAGGASSAAAYHAWVEAFAAGIGQRRAIVVVEPDALPGMDCLSVADQQQRVTAIADAVSVLTSQTKAYVYLDAGNASWQSVDTMAGRLSRAGVAQAQGFSLNVSNFVRTNDNAVYGDNLAKRLGGKHYVIDTSRNGNGPTADKQWCNPRGRALGARPTTSPAQALADAYLWIKVPGESDGSCNGAPPSGQWWDDYARELIANAGY